MGLWVLLRFYSIAGIYIQGSRHSHPFKVIEPETISSNQTHPSEGGGLQIRVTSNATPIDKRSVTESMGSEHTSSSVSMYQTSAITSGSLGIAKSGSRSSIERNVEVSASQSLQIENFIPQQVVLTYELSGLKYYVHVNMQGKQSLLCISATTFKPKTRSRHCFWPCVIGFWSHRWFIS